MLCVCAKCLPKGYPSQPRPDYDGAYSFTCPLCERNRPIGVVRLVEASDAADLRFRIWKHTYETEAA